MSTQPVFNIDLAHRPTSGCSEVSHACQDTAIQPVGSAVLHNHRANNKRHCFYESHCFLVIAIEFSSSFVLFSHHFIISLLIALYKYIIIETKLTILAYRVMPVL